MGLAGIYVAASTGFWLNPCRNDGYLGGDEQLRNIYHCADLKLQIDIRISMYPPAVGMLKCAMSGHFINL